MTLGRFSPNRAGACTKEKSHFPREIGPNLVRIRIPYPNKFIRMALVCRTRILRHSIGLETGNVNSFADAHLYGEDVKMVRRHKLHCRLLTPTEQDEAIAKYKTGMTMTDVANLYGCHYTTIGRLLKQRGISKR